MKNFLNLFKIQNFNNSFLIGVCITRYKHNEKQLSHPRTAADEQNNKLPNPDNGR
jgi:hypothetical protein